MQARYTRLFTDAEGESRFEDLAAELAPGFAAPPAEPLHSAPFLAAEGTFWVGAPVGWRGEAAHPSPRRMIFVTVQGSYEVTASEGQVRHFPAGAVLLLEDVRGIGHSSRVTGAGEVVVLAIGLPPAEVSPTPPAPAP
jgi:hypothetical protein